MLNWLKSLTKAQKRFIMLGIDTALVPISLFLAHAALGLPPDMGVKFFYVLPYVLIAAMALSVWLGVNAIQLNAFEAAAVGLAGGYAFGVAMASFLATKLLGLQINNGLHFVFGAVFFGTVVVSRAILLQMVLTIYRRGAPRCRVMIYGAGSTGTQLVSALRSHETIEPVAFVDDNKTLHGLRVARLPVYAPMDISKVAQEQNIDRVLLAVPSLSQPKQAQIARRLEGLGLEVQTLPSFAQLIGEEALIDKLKPVSAHSFLGRDEVNADINGAEDCYKDRVVLVSGGGGSIGSEICRQVLEHAPAKLILVELSELALYNADMELRQLAAESGIEIIPVLGSVTDTRLVRKVFVDHGVQVVMHAAAYKHVPLVEANPLAGLVNNVFGTQALAQQSVQHGIERFVLISSDKAVRPANVMGASKRLAELVVQDLARRHGNSSRTIFSMVRFGNVLGSSGSVVPLFQDQLRRGGPLTVTDRAVARYFMTVQEAVRLVLQAGAMAKGGEVFVLDMGKPVPIYQLAKQVIESAGYSVRDDDHPDGDIEIAFTGLRPGEKMTEELSISGEMVSTQHAKIFTTREDFLSEIEIASALRRLREAFVASDEDMARAVVRRWVEGFAAPQPEAAEQS
ncbi:MAG: polysaccharide biosynthesis protein [Sulfitobacter sp.]